MRLITLLNRCYRFKGFRYEKAHVRADRARPGLEVTVLPRKNSKPYCTGCGKRSSTYDRLPARRFEFIPLWGYSVHLVYARRRVDCQSCGVTAEWLPWTEGKHQLTLAYRQYLAHWAKKLSWSEVARSFQTSWEKVYQSVKWVVEWGRERRRWDGIEAIGVDEIQYSKGHKYLTLVYQIDPEQVRLLWVAKDRKTQSLDSFFDALGETLTAKIRFVCSDMWRP